MNKKYQLHQIHLTDDEFNKVNAEGHNSVEKHKLHVEMSIIETTKQILIIFLKVETRRHQLI